MTMRKIGLKLANGEFYPVLEEGSVARKRLVVTTVQDGQRSVQIDIYRGAGSTVAGAEYAGSLVIDNIPFAPKGEPDIRLDLGLDEDGKLTAYAEELSSGEHQSLEVSLEALTEENSYEIPDFAFEEETDSLPLEETPSLLAAATSIRESGDLDLEDNGPYAASSYSGEEIVGSPVLGDEAPRRKILPIAAFVVLALALVLGGAWLVYHFLIQPSTGTIALNTEPAASTTTTSGTALAPAQPAPVAVQPAPEAPAAATPAPAPTATQAATPAATPAATAAPARKPGVNYKLRWGDTLWDLAYTYYRNPWLYGKIAKANKIKNPDHIIAGHTIWIPPR